MLIEPVLQLLAKLKLHGMLERSQRQLSDPDAGALRFEERLTLLLQHELAERDNYRLTQRLRVATLPQPAMSGGSRYPLPAQSGSRAA